MNTVLPERDSPVTPSRITGSKNAPDTVDTVFSGTLKSIRVQDMSGTAPLGDGA